eukprot:TRINITY_DN72390_c0_g1_i1.p1 TRINITY_DN72390_c0_g1~~TRINITY_DN72390_c0_g1_i1.p1  ORF type:complete len:312 (-),score=88.44 TRINITY_DN72390_c0_g1_i1:39-974(-)
MPLQVGFVGLGAMGSGMASSLVSKGMRVRVFDMRKEAVDKLAKLGASPAASVRECAKDVDVLVLAVLNDKQVTSVLLDEATGAVSGGFRGVCVVCATVPPAFAEEISAKVAKLGAKYVDAPMSGGTIKAAAGQLTFMVSGEESVLKSCQEVLDAMGKSYVLGQKVGLGSSMKMVNQLLAGSHIVVAAEAMALGAKAGLDTRQVYEIITAAAGNSFMFENRVPHMLDDDPTPHSAVDIWPKDLGIVLDESKRLGLPCPMAGMAMQQFLAARGLGLGSKDDSFVVKVYEALGGTPVASPKSSDGPPQKRAKSS